VDGNPLEDISITRKVSLVMVDGLVVDRDKLMLKGQ
jgi:hypothetical protein